MKSDIRQGPSVFNSISDLHDALGLPKPVHPLISLVNYSEIKLLPSQHKQPLILNFYKISFKKNLRGKIRYGQNYYDFNEGGLVFISPNQLIAAADENTEYDGYSLLIHPDFLRNYPLGKKIKTFGFFSYSANEALHLSEKEKQTMLSVFENIEQELDSAIDDFSQDVLISYIEVLLNYSNRFYKRQFITRKAVSNDLLEKMDELLTDYFNTEKNEMKGLPTVHHLADQLHVSPGYLSDMLRTLTGQNAQQHIHQKLIEKAKEMLTIGNLTVADIAYQLGFEHPQSFNKLFKQKTNLTPVQFKHTFN